jgi:hypothetical protein
MKSILILIYINLIPLIFLPIQIIGFLRRSPNRSFISLVRPIQKVSAFIILRLSFSLKRRWYSIILEYQVINLFILLLLCHLLSLFSLSMKESFNPEFIFF